MLSQPSPHCPYVTNSLSSPLVSVAQILPRKLALVVMLEHLLNTVPSKVNGKMHSLFGFWLISEGIGDVLHVSDLAEKRETWFLKFRKMPEFGIGISMHKGFLPFLVYYDLTKFEYIFYDKLGA